MDGDLVSHGLRALQSYIDQFIADKDFQQVIKALPEILSGLRACKSITIGVNLDEHLNPEEAVLLSANSERYTEGGLLDRLLGKSTALDKGIAPIHSLPMLTQSSKMIIGLRAIYTTHLHELAITIPDINLSTAGDSQVVSMVASFEEGEAEQANIADADSHYSYKIALSPPLGRSYADRIAARYGISLEQLVSLLHQRKVLDEKSDQPTEFTDQA